MTIKRRLLISNILMIVVPVIVVVATGGCCIALLWLMLHNGGGLPLEDSGDFSWASRAAVKLASRSLEKGKSLDALGETLQANGLRVIVRAGGETVYAWGEEQPDDARLLQAAESLGGTGALADSVPGVSGGTAAFILGFYEPFLNAVHSLFGKNSAARRAALLYLLKLGAGWGVDLLGSILLLARMFENNIYFLSSLFFGLTLASVPCVVKAERRQILGKPQRWPFSLLGLALVCGLTWFRAVSPGGGTLDYTGLEPLQYGYLFLSGALAISAMALPGISGSSLLLIMGVYLPTVLFLPSEYRRTAGAVRVGPWYAGGSRAVSPRSPRRPEKTARPDTLADFRTDAGVPCLHCSGTRYVRSAPFPAGAAQFLGDSKLLHHLACWICSNHIVIDCKLKYLVQNIVDIINGGNLHTSVLFQSIVETLNIRTLHRCDSLLSEGRLNKGLIHINVVLESAVLDTSL